MSVNGLRDYPRKDFHPKHKDATISENHLNPDTLKSAIVSLVTSRLDYCNGLLCGITDELLCRLQKVHNNAARVVSGSKKYDHITPVLKDLHWLPIRKRIEFKILLLTFKCMQGCAPLYLRELLVEQANTRTLRSNTKNLLQIPLTNLKKFGDRAFCAYAPRLWNELPDNIKAADSVQNFKKQLKTLLFRKEFNWLYGPWKLSNDFKALLNIIGGKGAISNINYYYYYYVQKGFQETHMSGRLTVIPIGGATRCRVCRKSCASAASLFVEMRIQFLRWMQLISLLPRISRDQSASFGR